MSHAPARPATADLTRLAASVLDVCDGRGADGLLVIAPEEVAVNDRRVIGCAVRDGEGDAGDTARVLMDALGADALARTVVAYVGCCASGDDARRAAAEATALARHTPHVVVVEDEGDAAAARDALADVAPQPREHRTLLSPDGSSAARRFCLGPRPDAAAIPAMRVAVSDHQGKSHAISAALEAAGHILVDDAFLADAVLIDHDVPFHGKLPLVEACVAGGGRALLYPHGADPALMCSWDGLYPVSGLLSGAMVIGPGYAAIARRYGYPWPVHVIGWPYCPQLPRRDGPVRQVLFAPTHPPYLGNPRYPVRNAEIFERLLRCPVQVTVRHIGPLGENGLWEAGGVVYVRGDAPGAPGMLEQIDAADCVVADRSTFGNLAVSRGATTVLWDSTLVFDNGGTRRPDNLDRYRDVLHHPFDADDGDMWDLIRAAAADTARIAEWRERFIGAPLDASAVTAAIRAV